MNRRKFLKQSAGTLAFGLLPWRQGELRHGSRYGVQTLSTPFEELKDSYEVVIIGSGYGGAINAARLAGTRSVCVLERGREWKAGEYPQSVLEMSTQFRSDRAPLGLFDFIIGNDLSVMVGSGLGGTSLINANVTMMPDGEVFDFPCWPDEIKKAYVEGTIGRYVAEVSRMLALERYPDQVDPLPKIEFHKRSGRKIGAPFSKLDLAVNFTRFQDTPNAVGILQSPCRLCGNCAAGCNYLAKNSLNMNYLPLAKQRGAELFTQIEVRFLEKTSNGSYRVHFVHFPDGFTAKKGVLSAKRVIAAAGTLGTTQLFLRSAQHGGIPFSDVLGKRFSSNGDFLGLNYNSDEMTRILGTSAEDALKPDKKVGPTITSMLEYRQGSDIREARDRFIIEDGAIPKAWVDAVRTVGVLFGTGLNRKKILRTMQDLVGAVQHGALNHSMVYLGIGFDNGEGRISLDARGKIQLRWDGYSEQGIFRQMKDAMEKLAETTGGNLAIPDSVLGKILERKPMTVHPLGGCVMGKDAENGVVDHAGRVFDPSGGVDKRAVHGGLYVSDGSIIPTSLGVNPFLTISALSERIANLILLEGR